jgi:3-hydroxybutyryl-CoA dehydrogenase
MITKTAVIGSGYMGGGIAQILALAGCTVKIADISAEIAEKNLTRIIAETADFEAAGLFPAGSTDTIRANISAAKSMEDAVDGVDFIEEAVPETVPIKKETLARISAAASPTAIIGSNTSTIPLTTLAEAVEVNSRFLGIHFSNPAPFIPGVELIPHAGTAEDALVQVEELLAKAGKITARITDAVGFVLNRLQYALFHEATALVEEGIASADSIDTIVRTTFGFRLPFFGPFAIADMAGLDVYAMCYTSLQTRFPERFATPAILKELVDAGKLGTKSGAGFLDVPADRIPALIAYRNKAYVKMQQLLDELGPAPID